MTDHAPTRSDAAHHNGTLASMCLALVLVVASVASVNLALAGISVDLGATSSQLTWIADGYTVALAALVLPFGALGDLIGRRTMLLIGTAGFGVASFTASFANSAGMLIACRIAMGIGAAMIMPATLSTITAAFADSKRDRAVSIWAGFASSGAILGLLTCGLLLEWWTWRATFVATAVLAVITFIAARVLAPNTSDPHEALIDVPGYLLSGVGVGALVYGIIGCAESGWTVAPVSALVVSIAALTAFVLWELHTPRPMLDVRLFALRGFSAGTLALTVQFLCLFGFFFVGMQFLQLMLGYSPLRTAVCLLPMGAVVMPISRIAPHIVERFGQRAVMSLGLALLAGGLAVLATMDAGSGYWHFLVGLLVFGLGMALASTPSTTAIVTSLPRAKQGVGSAVNDVSRELGSALGIAILGSLFNAGYSSALGGATDRLPPELAHAANESPGAALAIAARLGAGGNELAAAVRVAFADGLSNALWVGAAIALAAAAVVAWRAPRGHGAAVVPVIDEDRATPIEDRLEPVGAGASTD
jgi:EmrB/QacA subfamily drug resistance transporter